MIYTGIDHLHRYLGASQNLDLAIRFITEQDLNALHNGRNEISGEEVYVNVLEHDTIPEEEGAWEAHAQYADIHVDLAGFEKIGVTGLGKLKQTGFQEEADFISCEGPVDIWVPMEPGVALIVFPEDAHTVKIQNGGVSHVRRAVFKVKV